MRLIHSQPRMIRLDTPAPVRLGGRGRVARSGRVLRTWPWVRHGEEPPWLPSLNWRGFGLDLEAPSNKARDWPRRGYESEDEPFNHNCAQRK